MQSLFDTIKNKSDAALIELQEICYCYSWIDLANIIKNKLRDIGEESFIFQPTEESKENITS